MTNMLKDLGLESLKECRTINLLVFFYKVVGGLVPSIPLEEYLQPVQARCQIKSRKFPDCATTYILDCQELNIIGDLKWNSVGLNNTEILSSPEQPWTGATYTIPYCMQRQLRALKQPFGSVTNFSLHVLFWCAHAERPYVTLG